MLIVVRFANEPQKKTQHRDSWRRPKSPSTRGADKYFSRVLLSGIFFCVQLKISIEFPRELGMENNYRFFFLLLCTTKAELFTQFRTCYTCRNGKYFQWQNMSLCLLNITGVEKIEYARRIASEWKWYLSYYIMNESLNRIGFLFTLLIWMMF